MSTLVHSFPANNIQTRSPPTQPPARPPPPHLLAALASQHHASEYNRLKFGPKGCPVLYQPLSLAQPDYFSSLRLHQRSSSALSTPWWPADPLPPPPPNRRVYGPNGNPAPDPDPDPALLDQITAAIDEPLFASPSAQTPPAHPLKTSATHPINISSIIPLDLLPFIASHALLRDSADSPAVPTVLDIPPSLTLDRLALPRIRTPRHTIPLPPHLPPLPPTPSLSTRATVTEALHAAINTAIATSVTDLPPIPSPPLIGKRKRSLVSDATISVSLSHHLVKQPLPKSAVSLSSSTPLQPALSIGNLLMSSCPGKKVRLQGPIRGRSGVCRDLKTDLHRMKDLGVGCIVCCLDDDELQFLGAPWPEYKQYAHGLGIDILRIPAPEGLPPIAPSVLDTYLTELIHTYTLRGIPVLVHCRGGVGRAGVVACCWLIKLGLCGWVETSPASVPSTDATNRNETIQLIAKVIDFVRMRRSPKAIETYEQVRFLVDFVEHLCSSGAT